MTGGHHLEPPHYENKVSFGSLIQIVVLVAGLASGWALIDARSRTTEERVGEQSTTLARALERVRFLESSNARNDERLSNIVGLLTKIDARLARIEER